MTDPDRRYRTLAGVYLSQALEAFRAAGSSDTLYGTADAKNFLNWPDSSDTKAGALHSVALEQQAEHCRTAILFAALSGESYVNEYLQQRLGRSDFDAIDRLPTAEKLVIGCRLVGHGPLYERGAGDGQIFAQLFKLRNDLVHPRPGIGRFPNAAEWPSRHETFNPPTAIKFVLAVARVGSTLIQAAFPTSQYIDTPSNAIVAKAKYLLDLANTMDASVPSYHDQPLPELAEVRGTTIVVRNR